MKRAKADLMCILHIFFYKFTFIAFGVVFFLQKHVKFAQDNCLNGHRPKIKLFKWSLREGSWHLLFDMYI